MPYEEFKYNGGSANVNLLNGELTASFNLLNVSTLKNPMSLQLYYNDGYSDIMSEFGMPEIFGKNMKLNFQQVVNEDTNIVRYVDEDGSIEEFRYSPSLYFSLNKSMSYVKSDHFLYIAGNKKYYFKDNYLKEIYDTSFENEEKLMYQLTYSNNKITSILGYANGLSTHYVSFTYSGDKVSSLTSYVVSGLSNSTYVQLNKLNFTYDDSGNLVKITNAHSGNDKYVLKYNEGKLYEVYDFDGNGYQFSRSHWSQQSIIKMAAVTQISKKGTTYEEYYDGDYVTFSANNSSHDYATVTEVSYYNSNYERLGRRFVSRHFFKGMGSEWYVNSKNETVISSSIADFSDDVNNEWFTYQKTKRVTEQKNNVTLSSNSSLAAGASVTGTISANHDIPNKTGASYFISFMLEASKTGYAQVFARGRVICTIHIAGPAKAYYFVPVSYFSPSSSTNFVIKNVGENYISVSSPSYNYSSTIETTKIISKEFPKRNYISKETTDEYAYYRAVNYDFLGQISTIEEIDRSGQSSISKTYTYNYSDYPNVNSRSENDIKRLTSIIEGTNQILYEYPADNQPQNKVTTIEIKGATNITKKETTTNNTFSAYNIVSQENGITTTVYYTVDCGDIRLTKSYITAGTTTEYSYNYDGQVDAITRGGIVQGISYSNGKVTGYSIGDATDISKRENYSLIRSSSDPSLITGIKYGGDTYASFGYTDYGDLNTVTYANGASRTYNYNDRKLTSIVLKDSPSATPTTINYGYSGTEINSITQSYGVRTLSYAFSNTKTQSSTTVSGDINANYVYNYDEINGRLLNRTTRFENEDCLLTDYFSYDSNGRLESQYNGDFRTAYSFDSFGRLYTKLHYVGSVVREGYTYTYYDDSEYKTGNIKEIISEPANTKQTYEYDEKGYITKYNYYEGSFPYFGFIYQYDSFGRLIDDYRCTYTYDKYNNLTSKRNMAGVLTTFNYSGSKLLSVTNSGTTKFFGYDALGNITVYKGTSATSGPRLYWTRGNMLSSGDLGNNPFSYEYGPDNLRYRKDVSGFTTYYYWDGDRLAGEITGSNITQYLYDASGIIGMKYNNNYYYFEKDILGNILRAYDTNGTIVASFNYDSFGNFNASGTMADLVKFRYRGYYYDAETGFYYLQNRYYDPTICRFISADKSSLLSTLANSIGELNLYVYCNNNPIMHTDPTGEIDWEKIGGWIATFVIIAIGVALIVSTGVLVSSTLIAANGLAAATMVGSGVGILASVTGNIIIQGGFKNINKMNPWSIFISGIIGGIIGAASGATSFAFSEMGKALGESLGYMLSNATHIGSGVNFAKAFGISTSMLSALGSAIGGMIGGSLAGTLTNNFANKFVTQTFGEKYTVDNPNYLRSSILKFFSWLYTF